MSIFSIGDLHLSLSSNKPMDVFDGWEDHIVKLEENWRTTVGEHDTVVIPGDISWAKNLHQAVLDFAFIDSLPGQKIIMRGNHDYWWTSMKKLGEWSIQNEFSTIRYLFNNSFVVDGLGIMGTRGWFYDCADAQDEKIFNRELGRLRASIQSLDRSNCSDIAVFFHYPPIYRNAAVQEIIDILHENRIEHCYYGHIHRPSHIYAFNGNYQGIDMRLVSADYLQFIPFKIQ